MNNTVQECNSAALVQRNASIATTALTAIDYHWVRSESNLANNKTLNMQQIYSEMAENQLSLSSEKSKSHKQHDISFPGKALIKNKSLTKVIKL